MKLKIFLTLIVLCIFYPHIVWGFGISPTNISNLTLLPDTEYDEEIMFSHTPTDQDLNINYRIVLPKTDNWITVADNQPIFFPKNQSRLPIKIHIKIPPNTPYGNYSGIITFTESKSSGDVSGGSNTILGGTIELNFIVGTIKQTGFLLKNISPSQAEAGLKISSFLTPGHLEIPITLENTGNTKNSPDKVIINVYDTNEKKLIDTLIIKNIEKIQPFTSQKILLSTPTNLREGDYVMYLNIFSNNKLINNSKKRLNLTVFPAKTFYTTNDYLKIALKNYLWQIITTFVAIIIFITFVLRHFYRQKHSSQEK